MPITKEQQQRAYAGLQRLTSCPVCQAKRTEEPGFAFGDIVVGDAMTGPHERVQMRASLGHTPMLQVICKTCNHIMLFAAPPLGIP